MKIYKILLILICFEFCFEFELKSQNVEIKFPIEKTIVPNKIDVEPVIYAKTPGVVISNNKLIVMRSYSVPLYSVFEIPLCKYIGSFGSRGKGPNEFEYPDARTATASSNGFKLFDSRKGLLFVDISKYSISKKQFSIEQIKLPGELYILNDAIQVNDSIIYGLPEAWKSDKMFVKYNINSYEIDYFGEYPEFCSKMEKDYVWGLLWRHSVCKPDGTRFASFFDNFKMFRIYNNSEKLEKEVVMDIPDVVHMCNRKEGERTKIFYRVVKSTNEYIFAMCINETSDKTLEINPTIEIWDWDGNPIAKLKMDNPIFSFDVTPSNKALYCIDRIITDKIFVYNLESILK